MYAEGAIFFSGVESFRGVGFEVYGAGEEGGGFSGRGGVEDSELEADARHVLGLRGRARDEIAHGARRVPLVAVRTQHRVLVLHASNDVGAAVRGRLTPVTQSTSLAKTCL